MTSKYPSSTLYKIFSFGLIQNGVKIKNGILSSYHNWFPTKIKVSEITKISYTKTPNLSYFYKFKTKEKTLDIPYSTISGKSFQLLIKNLLELNEKIDISPRIKTFIEEPIEEVKFKLDFNRVNLSNFIEKDSKLSQKQSGKDAIIGFLILFTFIISVGLSFFLGDLFLTARDGVHYPSLNIVLFTLSGFLLAITISNIIIALVSMYLGHKLTFISLLASIILITIGILI